MAPHASSFMTVSLAGEPEQLTVSRTLEPADSPAASHGDDHRRPLEAAQCSLCGIALPLGLLVPDGGDACADLRWYCKDARSCTERWTSSRPRSRANPWAAPADALPAAVGE